MLFEDAGLEEVSGIIGLFYDAVLDPAQWTSALEASADFVGGMCANIFWQDAANSSAAVFYSWGADPAYEALYFEKYIELNPMFPALTFIEPGVVFGGGDVVPHAEFAETRFFKEWVRPQGFVDFVGVNLQRYAASSACFVVRRGDRHGYVDEEARRRVALLAPHVRRAVLIGREIDHQKAKSITLETLLNGADAGVFLVDAAGRLRLVNDAGRAQLDKATVVTERQGALSVRDPAAHRRLMDAVAAASRGDVLSLGARGLAVALGPPEGPRWVANVLPLASGTRRDVALGYSAEAAVFLRAADLPVTSGIEAVAAIYKLTPSEIRVLQSVFKHARVADIGAALGLSAATVKTHLASLFSKTGTSRRADLIQAVMAHGHSLI